MRLALPLLSLLALPALARADAIAPYSGHCPPGLDRGVAAHMEVCIPRRCETSPQCGAGADCRPVHECRAERDVQLPRTGRVVRQRVVVGACDAERRCADADATCETRRQCEPTAPTPAWDRATRRWTGVSHPARGQRPIPGLARGCAASGSLRPSSAPMLALLAIGALVAARRRSRRGSR